TYGHSPVPDPEAATLADGAPPSRAARSTDGRTRTENHSRHRAVGSNRRDHRSASSSPTQVSFPRPSTGHTVSTTPPRMPNMLSWRQTVVSPYPTTHSTLSPT